MHSKSLLLVLSLFGLFFVSCYDEDREEKGQFTYVEGYLTQENDGSPISDALIIYGENYLDEDASLQSEVAVTQTDTEGFYSLGFYNEVTYDDHFALRSISANAVFCTDESVEIGEENRIDLVGEKLSPLVQLFFVDSNSQITSDSVQIRVDIFDDCEFVLYERVNLHEFYLPISNPFILSGVEGIGFSFNVRLFDDGSEVSDQNFIADGTLNQIVEIGY